MSQPNYSDLWRSGPADQSTKQSIIGGLQQLLNEKQGELQALNSQLTSLRHQLGENAGIMEQMEKQFVGLQKRLKQGESSGSGGYEGGSAEDKQTIQRLTMQLKGMEDKMYVFSNLPSRITDLESKLEKQHQTIEDYEDAQENLKATIRKLSTEGGADKIIMELQDKVKNQVNQISQLKTGSGGGLDLDQPDDQLRQQIYILNNDKNRLLSQVNELNAKLTTAHQSIQSMQGGQQEQPQGNIIEAKLRQEYSNVKMERDRLAAHVSALQQQLAAANPAAVPPGGMPSAAEASLKQQNDQLIQQVVDLQNQIHKLTSAGGAAPNDLVQSLNVKINTLQSQNKKLQEDMKQTGGSSPIGGPRPVTVPGFSPSAPKIRSIEAPVSKEKEQELNQQIVDLRKQLADMDGELSKSNTELAESKAKLAAPKPAAPDTGANMSMLIQDMETKIKKLKDQLRQRDEQIAGLKQGK